MTKYDNLKPGSKVAYWLLVTLWNLGVIIGSLELAIHFQSMAFLLGFIFINLGPDKK